MRHRTNLACIVLAIAAVNVWAAEPALELEEPVADPLAGYIKPAEWLRKQPRPKFKEGHTLPPLTRYGWSLGFDTRVDFAEHWGYCLEFSPGYITDAVLDKVLKTPDGPEAKTLALAIREPTKYKLSAICSREMPARDKVPPETWTRDANGNLLTGKAVSQDGTVWTPGMETVWSPLTPDSVWREAGRLRADPMRRLREMVPIAVVLNGGEFGLAVPGWGQKVWGKDPAIVKAKGERSWAALASEGHGRLHTIVADAVREAVPDRTLYVYYSVTGNGGPGHWGPGYLDMKRASDLPSTTLYYKSFNSGWGGKLDLLTKFLTAKAYEIAAGQPLSYNWLSAGWTSAKKPTLRPSDMPRYMGFLRCCYTAGMIGGNAGCYGYPRYPSPPYPPNTTGFDVKFPPNEPPNWIEQMVALGRVHAQFSHLEHYLRQGDLLPGPDIRPSGLPAYEFPTGDPNARAVVRKLRDQPRWLLTAWAVGGGSSHRDGLEALPRDVKVTVPELGEVTLTASNAANVYEATLKDGKAVVRVCEW